MAILRKPFQEQVVKAFNHEEKAIEEFDKVNKTA